MLILLVPVRAPCLFFASTRHEYRHSNSHLAHGLHRKDPISLQAHVNEFMLCQTDMEGPHRLMPVLKGLLVTFHMLVWWSVTSFRICSHPSA